MLVPYRNTTLILTFVSLLLVEASEGASPSLSELSGTSLSLGGAYVTAGEDLDAYRGNPALLATRAGKNSFGGNWQKLPSAGSSWQIAATDGKRRVINGLHFNWWEQGSSEKLSFSFGGAYKTSYGVAGVTTSLIRVKGIEDIKGWKFTTAAGILTPAFHGLSIGVSLKNVLDRVENKVMPPELAMGLRFEHRLVFVHLHTDRRFSIPNQDWNFSTGIEVLMQQFFSLRGGYRFDRSKGDSYFSVGAGLKAPRADLSGFFMQTTKGDKARGFGFQALFLF
ncbi:MAG: hypothetical protein EA369_01805 [Bradymonadales bacterium]|nr:MAG: hypothetical protein EA369_01805 [Bradymonadales bacterium]